VRDVRADLIAITLQNGERGVASMRTLTHASRRDDVNRTGREVNRRPDITNSQRTHEVRRKVDATTKVSEVLRRYPRTRDVFHQHGPLFEVEPEKLYLQYPERTVAEYAEGNNLDLAAFLQRLNAEAEAVDLAPGFPQPAGRRRWPPEGPIGDTGGYVELKDSGIETEPFVAVLLARGPD
jgi:hypothetical protein